jgi:hypothetical protein
MSVLNFMTAIFWGQLRKCTLGIVGVSGYSCTNRSAYGAVCTFSVFIFLLQTAFCVALIQWRNELISNDGASYDDVTNSAPTHLAGGGYEPLKGGLGSNSNSATSADL